jgi:hypothetical protein
MGPFGKWTKNNFLTSRWKKHFRDPHV